MRHFILNEENRHVEVDVMAWARWFNTADRIIAQNTIGDSEVSTVFLGIDHRYGMTGPPILYETMIFGGKHDGRQLRYMTRNGALAGHKRWVKKLMDQEEF